MLGQVTSLFVRKVLAEVDAPVDADALLRSAGLDPGLATAPPRMIPDTDYYAFLETLTDHDTHPVTLPLRAGAAMRCDDYGAFGLAWKSAPDLGASYASAVRYARVLTNVSAYAVEPVDGGAWMHLHRDGPRRLGLRLSNEATIASIASISRQVSTREFRPLEVRFRHPAPGGVEEHAAYFGCPVRFDSDRDALLVSRDTLRTPNRLGDAGLSRFFRSHLDSEVSKFEDPERLDRQVVELVSRSLSGGIPRISDVARRLCLSSRTLQRRLADDGRSYQSLVDEARRRLSARLLRETDYPLGDLAFMTGFSDQSACTRAFKRWEGRTPRSYRLGG